MINIPFVTFGKVFKKKRRAKTLYTY